MAENKEKQKRRLKTKTAYEAEKKAKPASYDTNKDQKTASEGTPTGTSKSILKENRCKVWDDFRRTYQEKSSD